MKKTILFFYPSNKRSVQIETTLIELKKLGYQILLLSTCKKGALHEELEKEAIQTFSHPSKFSFSLFYYINQILYLAQFIKKHKVDFVYSNLQHANFIAVFAQYLVSARVVVFRHHFKFNKGNFGIPLKVDKNELFFDKVINQLAKKIIVPSSGVYNGMMKYEKVRPSKVSVIPYLYNFSAYNSPDPEMVQKIQSRYPAELRIIMVARLIPFKRHILMFPVFKKLIGKGYDLQVIILDEGPEKEKLQKWIEDHNMQDKIHLIGFTRDFINYMKASDLLIHPSITEASNNVVKEIGLMKKAVAVCSGVGDFDDYIINGENGYFMDIEAPHRDASTIIKKLYKEKATLKRVGENLNHTILSTFGINHSTLEKYVELIEKEN